MAIKVHRRRVESADGTLPAIAVEITEMVDSYMVWIGVPGEEQLGNLCSDWACAMPASSSCSVQVKGILTQRIQDGSGTPLFRSSKSDLALSMAQRLGK